MKPILLIVMLLGMAIPAAGETILFSQQRPNVFPAGWVCGVTGHGNPNWTIERDTTAPNLGNVLRQSGAGDFPWCVKQDVSLADGFVEVRFKPVAGREDQAGGVVWRWKVWTKADSVTLFEAISFGSKDTR